jgi:hypothetical protein
MTITTETVQSLPYVRLDSKTLAFALESPNPPTGTGLANAVRNNNPFSVRVYAGSNPMVPRRDSLATMGTHIVDPDGNDVALPADSHEVILGPGAKVYYAKSVPLSWRWYGT